MTRRILLILCLAALTGCAAAPPQDRPDCAKPDEKPPIEGGIGGTGNTGECAANQGGSRPSGTNRTVG